MIENLEIILENFKKNELDNFIFHELKINPTEVKSSHFFDNNRGSDIEFHQIKSLNKVLSPSGTGNVFLNQLELGCRIKDVVIVFSFDEQLGDITFNFSENELFEGTDARLNIKKTLETLISLKDKFNIPTIRIGFEPASDDDTCIVKIGREKFDLESAVELILK